MGSAAHPLARVFSIGAALLLGACTMVNVTPLGETRDGRHQYELRCNERATDTGSCHERAVALCDGSYETQTVGSRAPGLTSFNGQMSSTPAERVLLIACNR